MRKIVPEEMSSIHLTLPETPVAPCQHCRQEQTREPVRVLGADGAGA